MADRSSHVRVLFLGDIVGGVGLRAVCESIPALREQHAPHLIIANAENAAQGSGLIPDQFRRLREAGVDGVTLGDHALRKKQIATALDSDPAIIRPANLPAAAPGTGVMRLVAERGDGLPPAVVYVTTVLGQLFITMLRGGDPFAAADQAVATVRREREKRGRESFSSGGGSMERLPTPFPGVPACLIVEAHCEATSEKSALGWHLNGRAAAVLGSHTHVQTADARLLPRPRSTDEIPGDDSDFPPGTGHGTAYLTDLGMCGPRDSVIGRRPDRVVKTMTTTMPTAFDVAAGSPMVQGALVTIDPEAGLATAIERIDLDATP